MKTAYAVARFACQTTRRGSRAASRWAQAKCPSLWRFTLVEHPFLSASIVWLLVLLHWPASTLLFWLTVAGIAASVFWSTWMLYRRGRFHIRTHIIEFSLFTLLCFQLFCAFGPQHYRFVLVPPLHDWPVLCAIHALHAGDLVDSLQIYGVDWGQNLRHASVSSGCILIAVRLVVGVFLLGAIRNALRVPIPIEASAHAVKPGLRKNRRLKALLSRCAAWVARFVNRCRAFYRRRQKLLWIALVSGWVCFAFVYGWKWFFLWPLHNVCHALDFPDFMYVFDWRIYDEEMTFWTRTLSLYFRLLIAFLFVEYLWEFWFILWGWRHATREEVVEALRHRNQRVRLAAANRAALLASEAENLLPPVLDALVREKNVDVQEALRAARAAIDPKGDASTAYLVGKLKEGIADAYSIFHVLEDINPDWPDTGEEAYKALCNLVGRAEAKLAGEAIDKLKQATWNGDATVRALIKGVQRPEWELAVRAIEAAAEHLRERDAVSVLGKAVEHEDARVALRATEVLKKAARQDNAAVEQLSEALKHKDGSVRLAATEALGQVATENATAVRVLLNQALTDSDRDIRKAAQQALAGVGPRCLQTAESRKALTGIIVACTHDDRRVRNAAWKVLNRIEPAWEQSSEAYAAVPQLGHRAGSGGFWVRREARKLLKATGVL